MWPDVIGAIETMLLAAATVELQCGTDPDGGGRPPGSREESAAKGRI